MKKRLLACLLTAAMLVSLFPLPALAAEAGSDSEGLCPHHTEHSYEVCGCIEAVEGTPCGYVCEICGVENSTPSNAETVTVESVQAMIDVLPAPEDITPDNRAEVEAQLEAIDTARAGLTDEDSGQLDTARYQAAVSALAELDEQIGNDLPMPVDGNTGDFTVTGGTLDTEYTYDANTKTLTISTNGTYTITGTGVATQDKIVIADGVTANVTLDNVNIDVGGSTSYVCAFRVEGNATCNLTLTGVNTLKSGYGQPRLSVSVWDNKTPSLTITANSTGSLEATGGTNGAGIGGGSGGNITINGGTVTASGGTWGAGIGGGERGAGGNITINGGMVTAIGGTGNSYFGGAGIGCGGGTGSDERGKGGTITINGGTVTASRRDSKIDAIGGLESSFSTGTDGSAFIVADSISDQSGKDNGSWSGVIFEGNAGTVYGTPTLKTDAEIPSGKTLTIEDGKELTIGSGVTLTNNGTITIDGTLNNNGTVDDQGTINGQGTANPKIAQPDTQVGEGYSIDYATKKITIETGYEVENLTTGATVEPGTLIKCYKPENDLFEASKPAEFTTPALRAAPTVSINYKYEDLTVDQGNIEYSQDGTNWQSGGIFGPDFEYDLGWNGTVPVTVYARFSATDSDYASNPTGPITIPARPAMPDVIGVAPTTAENKDGKITGTAPGMKWVLTNMPYDSGDCTDSETTGLAPGPYYVWVEYTNNSFSSERVEVEVPSYENAPKYLVTVNNGTGDHTEAAEGWTVTVTAGNPPSGQQFTGWTVEPDTMTVPNTSTTSFTMPAQAVTVTANFETIPTPPTPTKYLVTVNGGTGGGNYVAGDTVTITATVPSGQRFTGWTVNAGGVTLANASNTTTTFAMPAQAVTVTANFETIITPPTEYTVTFDARGGNVTPAAMKTTAGKLQSLPVPTRSSHTFAGWYTQSSGGEKITVDNVFTADTTIYAHWKYTGGNSGGGGSSGGGTTTTTTQKPSIEDSTGGSTTVPMCPRAIGIMRPFGSSRSRV